MDFPLQFLPELPESNLLYGGSYSPVWVIISVLLAILGSYAAQRASARIGQLHDAASRLIWASISALTMGVGIWAMHFIGMLALSLPCRVYYDPLITLASMIPGILAAGVALGVVWHGTKHLSPLIGSVLLGAGIGTMHYTGMAAMQLEGFVRYDPSLFALSIIVAVVLSYIALRIKNGWFHLRKGHDVLVAVVMGGAASGMHYTGMSAAYFVRGDVAALPPSVFTTNTLAIAIAITTAFMALGALAIAAVSRNFETTAQLRYSEKRIRQLLTEKETILSNALIGIAYLKQRHVVSCNRRLEEIFQYEPGELIGESTERFYDSRETFDHIGEFAYRGAAENSGYTGEVRLRHKDGSVFWGTLNGKAVDPAHPHEGSIWIYSDISDRKKAEAKINELAFFDQLTGLPNRTLLLDRLTQTMTASTRNGSYSAVLLIDLDNFKTLNDTLGHDMGDLLLKQVAQRLTTCVRAEDTVARLGGDEFVVILVSLSTVERDAASQAEAASEKILSALNQTYQLKEVVCRSTPSIGVTLFGGHLVSLDDLLKQADLAMYEAKEVGRNAIRFFDPAMQTAVVERAALEVDLRRAIQEHQFLLHYQAQVVSEGRVIGAEVLLRWQHPQRGLVSPAEFIHLAEETGLILPLGLWVLETACTQLAVWATQARMADLTLSVNVSAHQFRQADFIDQVLAVLNNTGANPQRLKLELTESLLVKNVEDIIEKMFALKARGVGFSLDDFGTGYSSLSYLKRMPLDQLKIDQSFVRDVLIDPNDAAIARTVVALAQNLGLGVIAEGVETETQREFLASAGCHTYQGYFFSRPLPLAGFEEYAQQV